MSNETIARVAEEMRAIRAGSDPVSESSKEILPYKRRIGDALGALRAIVTDDTPTDHLDSDLQVVHGLVASLIGGPKATELISRLPKVRRLVATDVEAAFVGDPAATSYGEIVVAYPSILAVTTYRIAHEVYLLDEKPVARIMAEEAHSKTGIDIHPGATIGTHFFIDHGTGVVIGETCVIGDRVKLYHGVTLGAFSNRAGREDVGKKRHPTLGDDVTIYSSASILGGNTVIGSGSVIGGNMWLTESVPPNSHVSLDSKEKIEKRKTG